MNYFAPQTSDQTGNWWFNPYEPVYQGIRLTHQPSPWLGDFASLLLTPVTGELSRDSLFHRQSSYQLDQAIFRPDLLQLQSNRYRLISRLAPSRYGASFEIASLLTSLSEWSSIHLENPFIDCSILTNCSFRFFRSAPANP